MLLSKENGFVEIGVGAGAAVATVVLNGLLLLLLFIFIFILLLPPNPVKEVLDNGTPNGLFVGAAAGVGVESEKP